MVARKALQGEQTTLADLLRDAIDTFLNEHIFSRREANRATG